MNFRRGPGGPSISFQMTPMIDTVFLLLIYFMSVTSFQQQESELAVGLPAEATETVVEAVPLEIAIEIGAGGQVVVNNLEYDSAESHELPQLVEMLKKVSQTMAAQKPRVIIRADAKASHERVVDVLDGCAEAGLRDVSFPLG